jgi:hypothetical protein
MVDPLSQLKIWDRKRRPGVNSDGIDLLRNQQERLFIALHTEQTQPPESLPPANRRLE